MPDRLQVVIGFDRHETVAAHVLAHSIDRRSKKATPSLSMLRIERLPMWRERDPKQSTDFAFSRFLTPWLCNYQGMSIFLDCDMLCRVDINDILDGIEPDKAVYVVKHDYVPKSARKFLDQVQTKYERKNWSSVMVFNNALCRTLTPEFVNAESGLNLHQFRWLPDRMIGALDRSWNHLVGEYDPNPQAKIVHFTLGTPCFAAYSECEFAHEWHEERKAMLAYDRMGEYSRPERIEA